MTFDSVTFALFLPLVYALYWALPSVRAQNLLLLVASYVFYGAWDWRFLGLLFLASCVDFAAGLGIARGRYPRAWLALTLVNNLGILLVFKYLDWGIASFVELMELALDRNLIALDEHPTEQSRRAIFGWQQYPVARPGKTAVGLVDIHAQVQCGKPSHRANPFRSELIERDRIAKAALGRAT